MQEEELHRAQPWRRVPLSIALLTSFAVGYECVRLLFLSSSEAPFVLGLVPLPAPSFPVFVTMLALCVSAALAFLTSITMLAMGTVQSVAMDSQTVTIFYSGILRRKRELKRASIQSVLASRNVPGVDDVRDQTEFDICFAYVRRPGSQPIHIPITSTKDEQEAVRLTAYLDRKVCS